MTRPVLEQEWLTSTEAADIFRISRKTLGRYIQAGILPPDCWCMWGRQYRINRSALQRFMETRNHIHT